MSYAKYERCQSYPALMEADKLRRQMKARKAAFAMVYHTRAVEKLVAKCERELCKVQKLKPLPGGYWDGTQYVQSGYEPLDTLPAVKPPKFEGQEIPKEK